MNFLCTSDLHGVVPVQIGEIVKNNKIDAILYAGDYAPHGWGGGEGNNTEDPINYLTSLGLPVFSVFGNIDPEKEYFEEIDRKIENFNFIHLKRVRVGEYYIVGIGDFYMDPYALDKFESLLKEKPEKTIVVSHYPPRGVLDLTDFGSRVGSRELREIVEKYKPMLFICGHIHESPGVENLGETKVVNVSMKNVLVEIDKDEANISLV